MSGDTDSSKVRRLSVRAWANEIAVLKNGESLTMPETLMSLDYGNGTTGGFFPFLMPAGTYAMNAGDDLITFRPAPAQAEEEPR